MPAPLWITTPEAAGGGSGAYALVFELAGPLRLAVPRPRGGRLPAGCYVYFGSARGPGGLTARLARHLRADKRRHWHVDHLAGAPVVAIAAWPGGDECAWRAAYASVTGAEAPLPGFGSSDCRRCPAHLLGAPDTAAVVVCAP